MIGLVGLVSAVLLAGGIWFVARRVTRPILQLAATAAKVTAGDLEAVSGIQSEDEVGTLAVAFDEMTSELRANVATLERRVQDRTAELDRQKSYFECTRRRSVRSPIVTMDPDERVTALEPGRHDRCSGSSRTRRSAGTSTSSSCARMSSATEGHDLTREAARQRPRSRDRSADAQGRFGPRRRGPRSCRSVVDGEQLGYYAIYHDITELQAARREADCGEPGQERVPGRDEP